jgi:hypothetical protein
MQTVPAGTRLALVSPDGRVITPITGGGLDEQWAEPRWSPDGSRIAAIRWTLGGFSELVVLDTTGNVLGRLVRERAVLAAPSWSSDGRYVYFSSDRSGITNLYRVDAASLPAGGPSPVVERLSDARTGLFEPQPSPSDSVLAAVIFRADGYHVGVAPIAREGGVPENTESGAVAGRYEPPDSIHPHRQPARRYSPWPSLLPRYWIPFFEPALEENSTRIGAYTSGADLVGRHGYQALLYVPTDNSGVTGTIYYRNARLGGGGGQPLLELYGSQDWENFRCILDASRQNECVGILRRRIRDASLALTFQRPRARSFSYLSLAGGVEARDYAADSMPLLQRLDSLFQRSFHYPRVVLSLGWSNTQFPPHAISPEDGFAVAATSRYRWRTGDTVSGTHSIVGSASAFKSLDLPGFAHHVAALRLAGGQLDNRGTGYLEVGGVSGGTLDVLPGYVVGEGRRTFGVRGFPAASLLGMYALAGSLEYRAPIVMPGRGLGTLPLFLDRTSLTLFGDAGTAWCPGIFPTRAAPNTSLCTQSDFDFGRTASASRPPLIYLEPRLLASAGAELNISAAILSWDAPFRYRLGVAAPVAGRNLVAGLEPVTAYFAVGVSF